MDVIRFTNKLHFLRECCFRINTAVSVKNSLVFPSLKRQQQFQNTARRLPSSLFSLVSSVWKSDSLSDEVQRRWIALTLVEARSDPNFKHNLFAISFSQIHNIYVAVNFLTQVIFIFSFVSTCSLVYTAILKNKRKIKIKITWDKKLTTTYILYDEYIYHWYLVKEGRVISLKPTIDEPIKM